MEEITSRTEDTAPAAAPARAGERERQVTMFNRKAVVVLAGIAAMTVMVVSFAFNVPGRSAAADEALVPAEQVGADAARRNYLTAPPDTAHLSPAAPASPAPVDPAAGAYPVDAAGDGAFEPSYDPYATQAYTVPPSVAAAPAEPPRPSHRELSFRRAMRCGIRSCAPEAGTDATPAEGAGDGWEIPGTQAGGVPAQAQALTPGGGPPPAAPRDRHEAFLRSAAEPEGPYVASRVQRPASPYQLMAGTLIPVTLVTAINSDLPGEVVAQVTRNVYDTQQRHLLIPAGSRMLGKVDNQVGLGQARVNIAWHRLIFPNNNSVALPGLGDVDGRGAAGIRDRVNNHYGRTYLNAILLSAITAGAQLSQPQAGGVFAQPSPGQVAAGALGQQMGEVSGEMIRRNMQAGPTLEVRPGFQFSVFVSRDLVLEPYDHYETR